MTLAEWTCVIAAVLVILAVLGVGMFFAFKTYQADFNERHGGDSKSLDKSKKTEKKDSHTSTTKTPEPKKPDKGSMLDNFGDKRTSDPNGFLDN